MSGNNCVQQEGIDRNLHATFQPGDIVSMMEPYSPGNPNVDKGPFPFGIVAEILEALPEGPTRNVSIYLFDAARRTICLDQSGMPITVDIHCSALTLLQRPGQLGSGD